MKSNDADQTSPPNPPESDRSWGIGNLENIGKVTPEEWKKTCEETMAREKASNPGNVIQIWPVDDE
jgi:hypothetical protein